MWTPESEMKETIARVEKRGEELSPMPPSQNVEHSYKYALADAPGTSKDRLFHQTYEVPVSPICPIEVPELVSSDASSCSSRSHSSIGLLKDPPEMLSEIPTQNASIDATSSSIPLLQPKIVMPLPSTADQIVSVGTVDNVSSTNTAKNASADATSSSSLTPIEMPLQSSSLATADQAGSSSSSITLTMSSEGVAPQKTGII